MLFYTGAELARVVNKVLGTLWNLLCGIDCFFNLFLSLQLKCTNLHVLVGRNWIGFCEGMVRNRHCFLSANFFHWVPKRRASQGPRGETNMNVICRAQTVGVNFKVLYCFCFLRLKIFGRYCQDSTERTLAMSLLMGWRPTKLNGLLCWAKLSALYFTAKCHRDWLSGWALVFRTRSPNHRYTYIYIYIYPCKLIN